MKDAKDNSLGNKPETPSIQELREKLMRNVKNGGGKVQTPKTPQMSSEPLSESAQIKKKDKFPPDGKDAQAKPSGKTGKKPDQAQKKNGNRKSKSDKKASIIVDVKSFSENFYAPLPLLKRLNSHRCLALDIDVDKVRYIVAKKFGDLIQVESWGIQKFPAEISHRFKALQITMEHLKQKLYKRGTEVRVSVFSTEFMIRQEIFPYMKKKSELERAILYKFREEIKRYKDEKYTWGYDVIEQYEEQGIKKVRVQIVFAPWETINRYIYIFEHLKLPVVQLIPRPVALMASYNRMIETPKSDLLINISYDFTQILYLKSGKLEYIRNLGIGSRNLEFTIHNNKSSISMDSQGISLPETKMESEQESILRKRLLEKLKDLKSKQNPVLHTFFSEILRSIAFIQGTDRHNFIDRILLTGYGIQKESLVPYLKTRLNIPIFVVFPRLADRPSSEQVKFGEFFSTIGTMLQKYKGINLLPKKFMECILYRKLFRWLFFIIFITGLIAGHVTYTLYKVTKRQAYLVQEKEKEYIVVNPFEKSYKQLLQLIGSLEQQNKNLQSHVEARPPILEMMRLLSNLTPKGIRFNTFVFRKLSAGGKLTNQDAVEKMAKYAVTVEGEIHGDFVNGDVILINFINSLDNLKFFKSIKLDHKERDQQNNTITFGLTLKF